VLGPGRALGILLYHSCIHILNLPEKVFSRIAAKGWQAYMKEERHNKSPQIGWDFIEIIFQGNKWIILQYREIGF
jgi:hypothetical protein